MIVSFLSAGRGKRFYVERNFLGAVLYSSRKPQPSISGMLMSEKMMEESLGSRNIS